MDKLCEIPETPIKKHIDDLGLEVDDSSIEDTPMVAENSSICSSFFSTSDSEIQALDDLEIITRFTDKYPDFNQHTKDMYLRKQLLVILEDKQFILEIMRYYSLNINDIITLLSKYYGSLFNAIFIKKVKLILTNGNYTTK